MAAMKALASLRLQARLATDILGCGRSKVWLDPENKEAISRARTHSDVRELIASGIIARKAFRPREAQAGVKAQRHQELQSRRTWWAKQNAAADANNPSCRTNTLPPEILEQFLQEQQLLAEKSASSRTFRRQMLSFQRKVK
jgi:large subunit ribosomal protein L19e